MSGGALAAAVRSWMTRGRIKPAQLIRLSGLSRQTVYGILGGGGHPVTPTLMALAAALASRSLTELDPDRSLEPKIFQDLVTATAEQISGEEELVEPRPRQPQPAGPPATVNHTQTVLYEFFQNNPGVADNMNTLALLVHGGPLGKQEEDWLQLAITMSVERRRRADEEGQS